MKSLSELTILLYIHITACCVTFNRVHRGLGYFLFGQGDQQWFQLQYCQSTQCIKCYITINHTECSPINDQLLVLLKQRRELLTHLESSLNDICKSCMPLAQPPVTCLECPLHKEDCLPHIKLNINEYKKLVCKCDVQHRVVVIDKKYYLLLFEPSLQSGKSSYTTLLFITM